MNDIAAETFSGIFHSEISIVGARCSATFDCVVGARIWVLEIHESATVGGLAVTSEVRVSSKIRDGDRACGSGSRSGGRSGAI